MFEDLIEHVRDIPIAQLTRELKRSGVRFVPRDHALLNLLKMDEATDDLESRSWNIPNQLPICC